MYLLEEWVGNLLTSNFRVGTFVVASTHEALEVEYCFVRMFFFYILNVLLCFYILMFGL